MFQVGDMVEVIDKSIFSHRVQVGDTAIIKYIYNQDDISMWFEKYRIMQSAGNQHIRKTDNSDRSKIKRELLTI